MCSLFFNFAGALQRDAPKVSVGEETVSESSTFNVEEQTKMMTEQLIATSREISRTIEKLPSLEQSPQVRQGRIVELWKKKIALQEKLKQEKEELELSLSELQEIHSVLVQDGIEEDMEGSGSDSEHYQGEDGCDDLNPGNNIDGEAVAKQEEIVVEDEETRQSEGECNLDDDPGVPNGNYSDSNGKVGCEGVREHLNDTLCQRDAGSIGESSRQPDGGNPACEPDASPAVGSKRVRSDDVNDISYDLNHGENGKMNCDGEMEDATLKKAKIVESHE